MGKQSSRIYFQKKDHKDIYMNGHYHSAVYLCKESESGKVKCELVWRKIFDENLYIFTQFLAKWPVAGINCLTVNMNTKKVYFSKNNTIRDGKRSDIMIEPVWIGKKKCATFSYPDAGNSSIYINDELIFNNVYKLSGQLPRSKDSFTLNHGEHPARAAFSSTLNLLTIKKVIIKEDKVTLDTVSCYLQNYINLQGYKVSTFTGYNDSKYIYMLAKKEGSCILIQSDIDGNIKSLKLDDFDAKPDTVYDKNSPAILFAKGEKVYLLATKVIYDENTNTNFIINSITIVDGMKVISTEAIDSWSDGTGRIKKGVLAASIYNPTISPPAFIYSRFGGAKSLLITIDESEISTGDISIENFSFFVNLYENGEIVDVLTVSTKYDCTDVKTGIIWLFELSEYFLANVTAAGEDIKTSGFNSIVHYTENGWVCGGTHGVFYDEATKYFYTFYIKYLYPSSENFFIRFKTQEG